MECVKLIGMPLADLELTQIIHWTLTCSDDVKRLLIADLLLFLFEAEFSISIIGLHY